MRVPAADEAGRELPDEHGSEMWGNFPLERKRLFKLIKDTGAGGVVFLTGDRHLAEISKLPADHADGVGYPHGDGKPDRHAANL